MASYTKRGDRWNVRVRLKGYPLQSKTFRTKGLAEKWARAIEQRADAGTLAALTAAPAEFTLGRALEQYRDEVTPRKRSASSELYRIGRLLRLPLAARPLVAVRSADIAQLRGQLERDGLAANTVRLYLAVLSHLFTVARKEWGYERLPNPVADVSKPSVVSSRRQRRLRPGEEALLRSVVLDPWMPHVITLAIETAMRRGELARLTDAAIDGNVAHLPETKNGRARDVPLSPRALVAIAALRALSGKRLTMPSADTITKRFGALCDELAIEDLRFHDLRHEGTSRLFEAGYSIAEVASVTGHLTWAMLARYTHPRASDIAKKMAARERPATRSRGKP